MKYAAACIHMKDEDEIIGEWMAFHKAVGFDHLIMIDNGSSDRSADIIRNFPDGNSVSYIFAPSGNPQEFYVQTLKTFGKDFEWMAFIDADEFLYPTGGEDIRLILSKFEDVSAIGVFWHTYGSSGHIQKPDGLNIDQFTMRAEDDFHGNHHVKCIVRPSHVWHPLSSHLFHVNGRLVDENRRELHRDPPYGFFEEITPSHKLLRINHYHCRSRDQYQKKILRGYFGQEQDKIEKMKSKFDGLWQYSNQNIIEDKSAQSYRSLMNFYLE